MIIFCPFCKSKLKSSDKYAYLFCTCRHNDTKAETKAYGDGDVVINLFKYNQHIEINYKPQIPVITGNGKELYFYAGLIKKNIFYDIINGYEKKSLMKYLGSDKAEEVFDKFSKLASLT